ncbi:MAG: hypothetical protein ABEK59_08975 [Halobacteria archaeon]
MKNRRGLRLDVTVSILSVLMLTGITLDFKAHSEGISFEEEGFLTPEHVFFYTAFLAIAVVVGGAVIWKRRQGGAWRESVPTGYGVAVVGLLLFGAGGFGDFLWHSAFGFEEGLEALISPSHLLLATGAALFYSAPLRSRWLRPGKARGAAAVPVVISSALVLTIVSLFGQFINPLVQPYASQPTEHAMTMGVGALVTYPILYVGFMNAVSSRFELSPGGYTVIFGVAGLASVFVHGLFPLVVPGFAAGIAADVATRFRLHESRWRCRTASAAVPVVFVVTYFGVTALYWGIATVESREIWTVHVLGGTVALAGLAGLLLGFLVTAVRT